LDKLWKVVWEEGKRRSEERYREWRRNYEVIKEDGNRRGERQREKQIRLMSSCLGGNMDEFWKTVSRAMGMESREEISVLRAHGGRLEDNPHAKMRIMKDHYQSLASGNREDSWEMPKIAEVEMDETLLRLCNEPFSESEWPRVSRN
jgi:hypothetical protein